MNKEIKLDIWKKDGVNNKFICRECKYCISPEEDIYYCSDYEFYTMPDHFCANFYFENSETDGQ